MPLMFCLRRDGDHRRRFGLLGSSTMLVALAAPAFAQTPPANAAPAGGQVVAGSARIAQSAERTRIDQVSQRAAIDWQRFDVGRDHRVEFRQPDARSWTLNRVDAPDPSVIAGRVTASGGVAIVNRSGVLFAAGAQVDVGSLIASASNITNQNFMAGRMIFDGPPRSGARVENHGSITVAERGLAALVAPEVRNSGAIRARLGRVAVAGAETFTLDLAGDGLISLDVTSAVRQGPSGGAALVTNAGLIEAEGGSVLLTASAASGLVEGMVVNTGRIEAPTVAGRPGHVALRAEGGSVRVEGRVAATGGAGHRGGTVEATASGSVVLGPGARVDVSGAAGGGRATIGAVAASARGRPERLARRTTVVRDAEIRADATARGPGGEVIIHAAERTEMQGRVSATGGPQGGAGGQVEVSSRGGLAMDGSVDASAFAGPAGSVLIDPTELRVVQELSDTSLAEPAEITARAVSSSLGDLVLEATDRVLVLAAIEKRTGNLAIQTTGASATGIDIVAPVILRGGVLDVRTAGRITIAEGFTPAPLPSLAALLPGEVPVVVQAGTGSADVNGVRMTAGGGIGNAGTIIGSGGGTVAAGGTVLAVLLQAGGTLTNAASGSIQATAGASANGGLIGLASGAVVNEGTVRGPGVAIATTGALENAGTIVGTGAILYPDGARRAVLLRAGGALTHAASGAILGEGGAVLLESRGAITNAGAVQAATGMQLRALDFVANTGSLLARGDLFVAAGNWIDTRGAITAEAGRVALLAGGAVLPAGQSWALRQAGPGEIRASIGRLTSVPTGSGSVLLGTEVGAIELGGSVAATGEVRLEAANAALLARTRIEAETLVVRAGALGSAEGVLTLDGASLVIGQTALFGAGDAIGAGVASSLVPRGTALPVVLFDLRRGAAATATIPAGVAPDVAGVAPAQQVTQVRVPGQDAPASFGPASAAAAGALRLALDAGASPVFLLLDGGSASGVLQAGRLGVHGTGGSAPLSGSIGGRADGTAAQLADITRPIAIESQAKYLFNDCVIGLATCRFAVPGEELPPFFPTSPRTTAELIRFAVPGEELIPFFPTNPRTTAELMRQDVLLAQPLSSILTPTLPLVRLRLTRGPLADPDVVLPNTGEEDW